MRILILITIFLGVLMGSNLPKHYIEKLENGLEIVVIPMNNEILVLSRI